MSVELEPQELGFRRPFTQEVTQVLKLTNLNRDPVAFKVKTTAPKQYCVRPNSGYIKAGEHVEVQVLLQAMKEDPPLDVRCRDKFLVQSVAIDDGQIEDDANIWANIDKVAKDSVKEKKIRVNFLPERDAAAATNGTVDSHPQPLSSHPNVPQSHEAPPAYAPPSPLSVATSPTAAAVASDSARDFSTPSKRASALEPARAGSANASGTSHATADETKSVPVAEKASDLYNSAVASVSNAVGNPSDTLQNQLDSAEETIAQLKEQIKAQAESLRQRASAVTSGSDSRAQSSTSRAPLATQQQTIEGVPVQIVAGLCLMSFLIAYFFF